MFDVHVNNSGPLFDGRADAAVDAFCDASEEEIAQEGYNLVQTELGHVLKNPTGRYQSRVQTDRAGGDWEVNDDGVIYGPWLEGVESRNQTTRFKGYATFRRMAQALDARATQIAERVLPPFLRRMGG